MVCVCVCLFIYLFVDAAEGQSEKGKEIFLVTFSSVY